MTTEVGTGGARNEQDDADERRRHLFDAVPAGVWLADAQGRVLEMNPGALGMLGRTAADVIGRDVGDLLDDADRRRLRARIDAAVPGVAMSDRLSARHAGGTRVALEVRHVVTHAGRWQAVVHEVDPHGPAQRQDEALIGSAGIGRLQRRQRELLAELQHRTRNVLTIVRSVFSRTVAAGGSSEEILDHFRGRLDSLSRTQVMMTHGPTGGVDLENLVRDELLSVGAQSDEAVTIEGPEVRLAPRAAEMIGMAMHELTTNAVKFGALHTPGATLAIHWAVDDGSAAVPHLTLEWIERGVPAISVAPEHSGFGRELIEEALPYRLGATTHLDFRDGGVTCTMTLPLPAVAH